MKAPDWAYSQSAIIFKYWQDESKRIFVIDGLDHHFHILPFFKENDYCLITLPCHTTEWNFKYGAQCLESENSNVSLSSFIFLCNTPEQLAHAKEYDFRAIFFNHNALLDETVYSIRNLGLQPFNLVLNTRPEREFKRPHLASKVAKLAIIEGYNFRKYDYFDLRSLSPSFINEKRLSTSQVVDIYNMSMIGGIFSEKEGACYSSSEYLLCGLPVLSTPSEGGRDIWYNKFNSVICDPDEDSVLEGVERALYNLENGFFNKERIRAWHISMQHEMRDTLCKLVSDLTQMSISQSYQLLQRNLDTSNKLQLKVPIHDAQRQLQVQ